MLREPLTGLAGLLLTSYTLDPDHRRHEQPAAVAAVDPRAAHPATRDEDIHAAADRRQIERAEPGGLELLLILAAIDRAPPAVVRACALARLGTCGDRDHHQRSGDELHNR